jgi:ADP-ribosyl-[dinitrogen reductase] hydrolase
MELLHPGAAKAIIKLIKRENYCEQTTQLIDYAIPFKAPLKPYQEYYKELAPLTNKALGTVLGSVVGDSFGSITEFAPLSYTRSTVHDFLPSFFDYKHKSIIDGVINHCHVKSGQWSDDASMGLCIIDSLIETGQYEWRDLKTRFLSWWYLGYNNAFRFDTERKHRTSVGLGGIVGKALMEYMLNPEIEFSNASFNQSGNGSLMRNAGIPVYYHNDLEKAISYSINQSYLTHTGIEAAECCAYLSYIAYKAINFDKYVSAQQFLDSCTA